jgi:hypothetical protein
MALVTALGSVLGKPVHVAIDKEDILFTRPIARRKVLKGGLLC